MREKKVCVVGAGVTGATIARFLAEKGITCDVFEARDHVAGNCHNVWDDRAQCFHHVFGPHIFHTNSQTVIDWMSRFCEIIPYKHSVKATAGETVYSLPINLYTLNQFFGAAHSPEEAKEHLSRLTDKSVNSDDNFETRALSFVGRDIYKAFFEGYTRKQWGVDPEKIPSDILKRLPIRFNYDDNYFFHTFQGLPKNGYTDLVEKMLEHPNIGVHLNKKITFSDLSKDYSRVFWSGPIEEIFNADEGYLPYRTLDFDTQYIDGDAQGCPVMNYPDKDVPHTRCTQHNYFRNAMDNSEIAVSLVSHEYSRAWELGDIQYYPVHLTEKNDLLDRYLARAEKIEGLHLCGRLGRFKYMDMDVAIDAALDLAATVLKDFE